MFSVLIVFPKMQWVFFQNVFQNSEGSENSFFQFSEIPADFADPKSNPMQWVFFQNVFQNSEGSEISFSQFSEIPADFADPKTDPMLMGIS